MGGGEALSRLAAAGHARHQEPQAGLRFRQEAVEAEGHGPRARWLGAFASLAARRHGPRTAAAQLRLRVPAQEAAGRAALGAGFEAGRRQVDCRRFAGDQGAKTKLYRTALDKLDAKRTALLVENGKTLSQALLLGARNLKGVELVLNNEVHPYDLLRYERAIFSKAAIEQLAEALKKSVSKRKARADGGCVMPTLYTVIRRPLITEKGLGVKETEGTLVFDVAPDATKTEVKQAVETLFKVKVAAVRTANVVGKERRRGKFAGFRPDWKKAYVRLKAGEKMPEYVSNL